MVPFLFISFGQIPPILYHHYEFNSKHNFENCNVDGYSFYLSLPTQYWKFNKPIFLINYQNEKRKLIINSIQHILH